jgi:hypothetical protein
MTVVKRILMGEGFFARRVLRSRPLTPSLSLNH